MKTDPSTKGAEMETAERLAATSEAVQKVTGETLIVTWTRNENGMAHRAMATKCPGCGDDLMTVALTALVYSYEACDCGEPHYEHLVEQLWHRRCFVDNEGIRG